MTDTGETNLCDTLNENKKPCGRKVLARGKCGRCYQRLYRHEHGTGRDPDAMPILAVEHFHKQVATRVSEFAKTQLQDEVAERIAAGEQMSEFLLVREIIHNWATARVSKRARVALAAKVTKKLEKNP